MPSFFSKVLGRKKGDDSKGQKRSSAPSLLEGKFEAVSPNVSPSAAHFPPNQDFRGREKAKAKHLFRVTSKSRSRARSPPVNDRRSSELQPPLLSLNLSVQKDQSQRALGVLFEADPDGWATLSDSVLGERRLTPQETLALVNACSRVIVEQGLETLGIMHAHWHSASLDVQRKLISLYVLSIAPPVSKSTTEAFETELGYARSPHDVAAVLRWGLRHFKIDGESFGKAGPEWLWYEDFAQLERSAVFPANAYTTYLLPHLSPAHTELLGATLDIISSLASHSEANGFSGSKLSKYLGLWLLCAHRWSETDDWYTFYGRWEKAGRILEHIFLARIRNDASMHMVPRRLTELVDRYPYTTPGATQPDLLLPRPHFSTRAYDALFVRLETEYTATSKPKPHPFNVLANAFRSTSEPSEDALLQAWDAIKQATRGESDESTESLPVLTKVFSDTTLRLLSLIPVDPTDKLGPTFALRSAVSSTTTRHRSFSAAELSSRAATQNGHGTSNGHGSSSSHGHGGRLPSLSAVATSPTTATSVETPTDWLQFTSQGFAANVPGPRELASTLWDTDVEVTQPPPVAILSRKSSKRDRSRSVDTPAAPALAAPVAPPPPPPAPATRAALIARTKLDEAFIDFWTDALLDPIAASWPKFVVCELKPAAAQAFAYLVVEQAYVRPPPPPPPPASAPEPASESQPLPHPPRRPMSPESRLSSTFSITKKRFGFFTSKEASPPSTVSGKEEKGRKRASKTPAVGELGEVLKEEEEKEKPHKGAEAEVAAGAAVVGAAVVGAAATGAIAEDEQEEANPAPVEEEPTAPLATGLDEPAVPAEPVDAQAAPVPVPETVVSVPADATGAVLPPAPEQTVLEGSTPGPQVALATSEPVAVAQASVDVVELVPVEVGTPGAAESTAAAEEPAVEEAVESAPREEPVPEDASASAEPTVVEEESAAPVEVDSAPAPVEEDAVPPAIKEEVPAPAVEEDTPTPAVEESVAPVAEDVAPAPAVEEPASSVEEPTTAPVTEEPTPEETAAEDPSPAPVVEAQPAVKEPTPVAEEEPAPSAVIEEVLPAPDDDTPTLVKEALDLADAPITELTAPVEDELLAEEVVPVEQAAPAAVEEPVEAVVEAEEEPAPAAEVVEDPVVEEEPVGAAENASVAEPAIVQEGPPSVLEDGSSEPVEEEPRGPAPEPAVEEPVSEEAGPIVEDLAAGEPTTEEASVSEPVVEDAPTAPEPVVDEAPVTPAPELAQEVHPTPEPIVEEESEVVPVPEVVATPEPTERIAAEPVSEETAPVPTEEPSAPVEPSTEDVVPVEPGVESPSPAAAPDMDVAPEAPSDPSTSVLIAADGHAIVVPDVPEVQPEEGVAFEEPPVEHHIPLDEEEADDAAEAVDEDSAPAEPVADEPVDEPTDSALKAGDSTVPSEEVPVTHIEEAVSPVAETTAVADVLESTPPVAEPKPIDTTEAASKDATEVHEAETEPAVEPAA